MNNITQRIGITPGQAEQVIDAYTLGIEVVVPTYNGEFHFFTRKVGKNKEIRCMTYHSDIFNFMLNDYTLTSKITGRKKDTHQLLVIKARNVNINESIIIYVR